MPEFEYLIDVIAAQAESLPNPIPTCDYCSYDGPWPCPDHASPYDMDFS